MNIDSTLMNTVNMKHVVHDVRKHLIQTEILFSHKFECAELLYNRLEVIVLIPQHSITSIDL